MSAIVIEHVSRHYGKEPIPAVNDVSLKVEQGTFVTLVGPSGCGKTTLLKMINRLYAPTSGQIWIDGKDTAPIPATISGGMTNPSGTGNPAATSRASAPALLPHPSRADASPIATVGIPV